MIFKKKKSVYLSHKILKKSDLITQISKIYKILFREMFTRRNTSISYSYPDYISLRMLSSHKILRTRLFVSLYWIWNEKAGQGPCSDVIHSSGARVVMSQLVTILWIVGGEKKTYNMDYSRNNAYKWIKWNRNDTAILFNTVIKHIIFIRIIYYWFFLEKYMK